MDSGKSVAGKQSKPSHFDAAPFLVAAASVFITPEPGMSLLFYCGRVRGFHRCHLSRWGIAWLVARAMAGVIASSEHERFVVVSMIEDDEFAN